MASRKEDQQGLSWDQQRQVDQTIEQDRRQLQNETVFIEESPVDDANARPTRLQARAGPPWRGEAGDQHAYVLFEPHLTARARSKASARHRTKAGSSTRLHAELHVEDAALIDTRPIHELLNVSALKELNQSAWAVLERIRSSGKGSLIYIPETASESSHAKLLVFVEDLGSIVQVRNEETIHHPPGKGRPMTQTSVSDRAGSSLDRFRRASLRKKLAAIFTEALVVYGCGELAAFLVGDGSRVASADVTLPLWLVALPLIVLATAVKWLAWLQLRPHINVLLQRLRTLRQIVARRFANLDADWMQERLGQVRDPDATRRFEPERSLDGLDLNISAEDQRQPADGSRDRTR